MSYYIACKTALPFDVALARVRETLATEGFAIASIVLLRSPRSERRNRFAAP